MSLKTETVEVRCCDFCASREQVQACENCRKDVCPFCGSIVDLSERGWYVSGSGVSISGTFSAPPALMSSVLCNPCQRKVIEMLDAFGFRYLAAGKKKTA